MVLVLDNYDSFTYNLVQYLGELGAEIKVRRNDETVMHESPGCPDPGASARILPNQGVQATAYSTRSCLAPAFSRA